jgi:hypothetical protein
VALLPAISARASDRPSPRPELSDFSFGLSRCGLVGQGFGNRLAVDFEGQAEVGTVAWILGLIAMAVGFAASARGGSDRSTTQIAESRDLIGNVDALLFKEFQRLWGRHQGRLLSWRITYARILAPRKETSHFTTLKSRTPLGLGVTYLRPVVDTMQGYEQDLLRAAAIPRRLRRRQEACDDPEYACATAYAGDHLGSRWKTFRLDGRQNNLAVRSRNQENEGPAGARTAGG